MTKEDQKVDELLDRATAALRGACSSDETPQAVVDATLARLRCLDVSRRTVNRAPRLLRSRAQRFIGTTVVASLIVGWLIWLMIWPSPASALAEVAKNVRSANAVTFIFRAKVRNQAEQAGRVKVLGEVIRQESIKGGSVLLVNHRTRETLSFDAVHRGLPRSGPLPTREGFRGDPISQLLGVLETATMRVGDESVKGVVCTVFRGGDTAPLGLPRDGEVKIWVDPKTELPQRLEARWPERPRAADIQISFEDFAWNAKLDPAQFDMQEIQRESRPETARVLTAEANSELPAGARNESVLRLLGLALHRYVEMHDRRLPPATVIGPDGKTPHSWRVEILRFLGTGGESLYKQYRLNEPWDSPSNQKVLAQMPDVFRDANDDLRSTNSSFFALVGPGTAFEGRNGIQIKEFTDGTSATILLVEAKREVPWTKPEDISFDPSKPVPQLGRFEKGQFFALFADGTVHLIENEVGEKSLKRMIQRNDGKPVNAP